MDQQIYAALLSISGAIILILITLIGYFLKRIILTLDDFNNTLKSFSIDYSATKEQITNLKSNCSDRYSFITNQVHDHDKRLDINERDITVLQVTIKKRNNE